MLPSEAKQTVKKLAIRRSRLFCSSSSSSVCIPLFWKLAGLIDAAAIISGHRHTFQVSICCEHLPSSHSQQLAAGKRWIRIFFIELPHPLKISNILYTSISQWHRSSVKSSSSSTTLSSSLQQQLSSNHTALSIYVRHLFVLYLPLCFLPVKSECFFFRFSSRLADLPFWKMATCCCCCCFCIRAVVVSHKQVLLAAPV